MKIAVQDPNRVGEIVDNVTRIGANLAVAIRFLRRDETTIRRALLEEAVRETRQTADRLAAAAGRTAGSAVSICEDFEVYSAQSNGNGNLQNSLPVAPTAYTGRVSGAPPPLKYCARVSVTYQLQ
jgi:uncharacterized protein YggE